MIRTLIEVVGQNEHEHRSKLREALHNLGYVPKESPEDISWRYQLYEALRERGLNPHNLVEERRDRLLNEQLQT